MFRSFIKKVEWYIFISPIVGGFLLFGVFSIGFLFYLSLCRWDFLSEIRFVGLDNYLSLFSDELFHNSIIKTFLFSLLFIIPNAAISLFLALLVNQEGKWTTIFRATYFIPVITSITVVALIWQWLLRPGPDGPINYFISAIGIPPLKWLSSIELALPSVVLMTLWTTVGYYMVLWLAGLQQIPRELGEAAMLDGANRLQILWFVDLPLLRPVWFFVLLQSTLGCLQLFSHVYLLTGGGPAFATNTIVFHIWRQAFIFKRVGAASSITIVLLIITLSISLLMRRNFVESEAL